jgi:uncharacterized protein
MIPHPILLLTKPMETPGCLQCETNEISFILRPSSHEGVGVFCTHRILKGSGLRLFPGPDKRIVPHEDLNGNRRLKIFCRYYGLEDSQGCHVPNDFGRMEIGGYLNHSGTPNAYHDENYHYFARRDIMAGEEITIDYDTL